MSASPSVGLRILGIDFVVGCDDDELSELIQQLWAPFVTRDELHVAPACSIRAVDGGYVFARRSPEPVPPSDAWSVVLELRGILDRLLTSSVGGMIDLHAVVAEIDGKAILFPGDPGAGKTTLLLAGLESGWTLVCDDLSLMDLGSGRIQVLPRPIGIRAGLPVSDIAHRWTPPASIPAPAGAYLVPAAIYECSPASEVSIEGVVFPSFKPGAQTLLRDIGPAQALARIGRHVKPLVPEAMTVLSGLCARVPITSLVYGVPEHGAQRVIETFGRLSL